MSIYQDSQEFLHRIYCTYKVKADTYSYITIDHTESIWSMDWKMEKYYVDKAVIRNLSFAD